MSRRTIAAVWIAGATLPLLAGAVFLAGCCVLPFHRVLHQLLPLCETAANVVRGDHDEHHEHDATPAPARERQDPVKRIATLLNESGPTAADSRTARLVLAPITAYRSFITLGAVRCDQDVGLHVLVAAFLI